MRSDMTHLVSGHSQWEHSCAAGRESWGPGADGDSGAGCRCEVGLIHGSREQKGMEIMCWVKDSPRSTGSSRIQSLNRVDNESRTGSEAKCIQLKSDKTGLRSESEGRRQKLNLGI